ncbi:MAG: S8/S53 family peptidase [Bacteroides sp.]|nr:S8/S53 family peptidase [Bacillota bacterium]MCM1393344.1 S8/S53 family peptidase [[Eubacterium] siraeum]MCM1455438.1 S8/S53 family peptidase [Bacteroides sp.]
MKKLVSKKYLLIGVLVLVMAMTCLYSAGTAQALSYDGVDISALWYYGDGGLKIDSAKSVVDGWDKSKLTKKVVAVIDTGIDYNHEVFDGVLYTDGDGNPVGYDARTGREISLADMKDDSSDKHGNAIAGVIAIMIKELGLEDYIKIYPIKANKTEDDKQNSFDIAPVIAAINRAKEIGADAINMSLGATYKDSNGTVSDWATDSDLKYALENASSDVFIVAAAGNNGKSSDASDDNKFYPAVHDGVFGVMAYGKNGLYSKSNYGSDYGIAAPGEDIYTAKYAEGQLYDNDKDGTSLASATVAFAGALLKLRYEQDGKAAPNGNGISRIMKNLAGATVKKNGRDIKCLDFNTIVTQNFDETEFIYDPPTGIALSHNGTYGKNDGENDYTSTIYMRANAVSAITFLAKVNPYGETDPDLDLAVQWVLIREDETEQTLGNGLKLDYTPTLIDETVTVAARLEYGDNTFEQKQAVYLSPVAFMIGEVRVTYAKNAADDVDSAPPSGVVYTGETTLFSLTGIEYIGNKNKGKIQWYVDGTLAGEGATFEYNPKKLGTHRISARFDGSPVPREFIANVKPFIARPLDLAMLIIGLGILIAVTVVASVICVKRRRVKIATDKKTDIDEADAE